MVTEPKKLGSKDASPGGIFMTARWFLGKTQNPRKTTSKKGKIHAILHARALSFKYE